MLPVVAVQPIADLANQPNGALDPSLMVALHSRGSLHHQVARAWKALVAACAAQGLPLTFTYGGMYRTYAEQVTLFKQRYTTSFIAGQPRKWWQNQWWYLRKDPVTGRSLSGAAVPSTSNHGWGRAIDAAFDNDPTDGIGPDDATGITGHPKWAWFRDNVGRFGFSFEDQSEPWHIRYFSSTLPQAVLDFEKSLLPVFPPFYPANGQWSLYPLAKKPAAKLGDKGDYIKYLQGVLHLKCSQPLVINGVFDAATEKAVRNMQKFFGLSVDGWVGAQAWATIDWLATK
jgi:hypothetical protein